MATYSIWVLEYCWVPAAPKGLTVHGAFNGGTVKLPWCYVLIKGGGRTILVDVGYNHKDYAATSASPPHRRSAMARCGKIWNSLATVSMSTNGALFWPDVE